jgi:GTP-binding protein
LKHLERTRLLLHIVDACAELSGGDVVSTYRAVEGELGQYSDALADRPRWLVLNKLDLLPAEQRKKRTAAIVKKLKWKGPVYGISALTADGTKRLVQDVMSYLEGQREPEATAKPSRHGA